MKDKISSLPTELPQIYKIKRIKGECQDMKTFFFEGKIDFSPGQFVMLWVPRVDEKPFTISYLTNSGFGVTIQAKGPFTKKLFSMKEGDLVGIRGPYGTGFSIQKGKSIVVGGGCGSAPIAPLIEKLDNPKVIIGAKSKESLLFSKRFPEAEIVTDDGSEGEKMFATEAFEKMMSKEAPDFVYTCGPEKMMKKIVDICNAKGIRCEASLERYMKCGFGVCGQCACGKKLVCNDGPVFSGEELKEMEDFGLVTRTKSGRIQKI